MMMLLLLSCYEDIEKDTNQTDKSSKIPAKKKGVGAYEEVLG